MELLQYRYLNAYIVQTGSTDIGASWRKFKVRAKELAPEQYCNYVFAPGGTLSIYNADTKTLEQVAAEDWRQARPVFFEDHKYNLTITFDPSNSDDMPVAILTPVTLDPLTYSVIGSAALFGGDDWANAQAMTDDDDNTYSWDSGNMQLTAGTDCHRQGVANAMGH